jgi:hypothetical protein
VVSLLLLTDAGASATPAFLVPLYYMIGILIPLIGGLWALKRYADHQRQANVQQGVKEAQLSDKLEANTKAADKNTASIEKLGEKFDAFASAIDKRLTLTDYRVDRLEEKSRWNGDRSQVKGGRDENIR